MRVLLVWLLKEITSAIKARCHFQSIAVRAYVLILIVHSSSCKHAAILFLLQCKPLDGDVKEVQRTHVANIRLFFL